LKWAEVIGRTGDHHFLAMIAKRLDCDILALRCRHGRTVGRDAQKPPNTVMPRLNEQRPRLGSTARFPGKMDHRKILVLRQERLDPVRIPDTRVEKFVAFTPRRSQVGNVAEMACRQRVNVGHHLRAVVFQDVTNEIAAHKSAATSHEESHRQLNISRPSDSLPIFIRCSKPLGSPVISLNARAFDGLKMSLLRWPSRRYLQRPLRNQLTDEPLLIFPREIQEQLPLRRPPRRQIAAPRDRQARRRNVMADPTLKGASSRSEK
jgi:hypothetical protein